jgi:uncharacterized membrane protein
MHMATIEESIEVEVPVSTAYNQWTQFEEFPRFMDGVESVRQLDDTRLHWVADIGGERKEWDAKITEQLPDERVAWKGEGGPSGVVTFHRLGEGRSKVMVQLEYEPEGTKEKVGSVAGSDARQVKGDLEHFKEFIESRRTETGAWRGEVQQGQTR